MDHINAANIERRVMNLENEVAKLKEKRNADDSENEIYELRASYEQEKAKRLKAEAILIRLSDWNRTVDVSGRESLLALGFLIKEARNHLRIPQ